MSLGRYNNRRDANEAAIFKALRDLGLSVYPLDMPADALVGYADVTHLVEIKNGPKARFTTDQVKFQAGWQGCYVVLRSESEARTWAKGVIEGATMCHVSDVGE